MSHTSNKNHALLIGVSEFDQPKSFTSLPGVVDDLKNMEVLAEYGFSVEQLPNPTKDQILDKIQRYSGLVMETFVLYVSTHGISSKSVAYLIPRDARPDSSKCGVILGTAISSKELLKPLAGIKAKRILILLDTCVSGGFCHLKNGPRTKNSPDPLTKGLGSFTEILQGRGLAVLSAAQSDEDAICDDDGSVFTKRFVETLRSIPEDRVMLFTFVEKLQKAMENDNHMPVFKADNITRAYEWVIAENTNFRSNTNANVVSSAKTEVSEKLSKKRKRTDEVAVIGQPQNKKRKELPSQDPTCEHHRTSTKTSYTISNPGKDFLSCVDCGKFVSWRCPDLANKSLAQLKELCKKMKLKQKGSKQDLQDRIKAKYSAEA